MRRIILGKLSPQCVVDYCRELEKFLDWLAAIQIPVAIINSLTTAGYLQNLRLRGKSVPTRVRAALLWAEGVFKVDLRCAGRDISDFVAKLSATDMLGAPVPEPVKAAMVPPEYVVIFEQLTRDAPSLPPPHLFWSCSAVCARDQALGGRATCRIFCPVPRRRGGDHLEI